METRARKGEARLGSKGTRGRTHSDRTAVKPIVFVKALEPDGCLSEQGELVVKVHDVLLQALEVAPFLLVRGDGLRTGIKMRLLNARFFCGGKMGNLLGSGVRCGVRQDAN
jgi:hypothetical protein